MTSADTSAAAPALIDEVRAEQVRLLYANGGFPLIATFAGAAVLAALLVSQGTLKPIVAVIWLLASATHITARLMMRGTYLRSHDADLQWRKWAQRYTWGALAGGLTWGVGACWILPPGRFDLQMLVIMSITSIIYVTLSAFGSYLPPFIAFILTAIVPTMAWAAWQGDVAHWVYVGLCVIWLPSVAVLGRRHTRSIEQALTLRYENAALAESLQAQKLIAEQASLAKSRFLASASHDLRQPVHALGLFIGALRGHKLPRRSAQLVDQLDASVGALDGLFTSLLDISRLDAGVVETQPVAMAIQPLLARICRELAPEAQAKGVRLDLVTTTAAVTSDPVLLERVMRNLIANAVRYTETGRVLVGCRRRGGELALEVWDTGPGIPDHLREAVFEEFFQVANPDRDRARGLGLGLPIVRRLTAILDHPLKLESWPGRGTLFQVLAPRAAPPPQQAPGASARTAPAHKTGVILAIDDEQAIRSGLSELLGGWGHQVIVAGGGDEAVAALADAPMPDLILCDFRLRDGEDGVAVIRRLQSHIGVQVPAILITGDTATEAIPAAKAHGYVLMHKPLSHARLRAAISNLL